MAKKLSISVAVIALVLSTVIANPILAETTYEGKVVKLEGTSTLYYIALDGKRYVYPNEKTFKSWFNDFSDVVTVTADELAQYTLAGNIRYRPGVLLVKIQTDPKVYAISKNGVLRWIKTERLAKKLYGQYWTSLIDDIAASFFTNYTVGEDIDDDEDYDADEETEENDTVEENRGLKLGHLPAALKAKTKRCRAIPASPKEGRKRAISARICKLKIINDDSGSGEEPDETAPVISEIEAETTNTTATITWTTNEDAEGVIEYANENLTTASTTNTVNEGTLVTNHSVELTELIPETTYYFTVKSTDESGNISVSDENTFITEDEVEPADETAPVISNIQTTASSTSTIITWTTDEESDSTVKYATESLDTATNPEIESDSSQVTSHSIELTNLTASTTYYFIVKSSDENDNETESDEDNFTTTE